MATKVTDVSRTKVVDRNLARRLRTLSPTEKHWTPVDKALYGPEDIYRVEKEKAEALRWEAIKYSFRFHYEHSDFYRRYCQTDGITPESIRTPEDLTRIPLITDSFFKDYPTGKNFLSWLQKISSVKLPDLRLKGNPNFQDIMEALEAKDVTVTFTSGTRGRLSFFPRNKTTWSRQQYAVVCAMKDIVDNIYDPDMMLMMCVPQPGNTFNFLAKVTTAAKDVFVPASNMVYLITTKVTPDTLRIARGQTHGLKEKVILKVSKYAQSRMINSFISQMEKNAAKKKKIAVFGPPSIVETVMRIIERDNRRFKLTEDSYVATGGGWKLPTGAPMLDKQFRARINSFWGVPDKHCRDIYGMSECSSMLVDCEGHYKHIPHSVLYPMVLGEDLKPLGYGQYGRFAFLDPIPESYPGFIVTGDRVKMLESCPVCDRSGPVIESDVSRMQGAEGRGCSTVMAQMMANEMTEISKQ